MALICERMDGLGTYSEFEARMERDEIDILKAINRKEPKNHRVKPLGTQATSSLSISGEVFRSLRARRKDLH